MRLSGAYALRVFQHLIYAFGDMRAALLVQVINAANVAALIRTAEGRRATGPDGTFADEARRPISVARLADATGLPFESTRRIVNSLIDQGACVRVEGGVVVPRALVQARASVDTVMANVGYVRKFVRDLQAAGAVDDVAPRRASAIEVRPDDADVAQRLATFSSDYVLRFIGLLTELYGDIRAGIVAQSIFTANTSHLDARTGEGWRYAGIDEIPPDELRNAVSVAALAGSLGLPYETTRCHVQRLMRAGLCTRVAAGLIVPQAVQARPEVARAMLANVVFVRKFVHDLKGLEDGLLRAEHPLGAQRKFVLA
jgi:hypothetical protein